jgi:hypothetical protein
MIISSRLARLIGALLFLGAVSTRGGAQGTPRDAQSEQASALMSPGAHVRVKLPGEHAFTGTLVSLAGDSMFVRGASENDPTLVSLSQAARVDVSAGMRPSRHLVRNTAIGLGLGAFVGLQVGSNMTRGGCQKGDPCWEDPCLFNCDYTIAPITNHAVPGAVIGGLTGGALVFLVSRRHTEDWRPVSNPRRRTSVTLSPGGGRVAIAF